MLRHIFLILLCSRMFSAEIINGVSTETFHSFLASDPIPVVVWNRTVTEVRLSWSGTSAEARAQAIAERIANTPDQYLNEDITAVETTINGVEGILFSIGGRPLFGLARQDLENPQENFDLVKARTISSIKDVFKARLEQRKPDILLWASLWSVVATVILVAALWLLRRISRSIRQRVDHLSLNLPRIGGVDLTPACRGLVRTIVRLPFFLATITALYIWITFILGRFPLTHPLARSLGEWLLDLFRQLGAGAMTAMPGLFTVAVILFITRQVVRLVDGFFQNVESGILEVTWMQPETAKATRRIAGMLIWLFALTVAYPYIPGSSSDAFRGVSVFAGLLLTLGSAGMVNQIMSGLVVVYSRMMKPGDMVKVGDVAGVVTELGFLSTKVRTPRGHEITMPNAVIVNSSVSNFSRFDPARGPTIATAVTIGYDTPWRQVHGLLTLAASRTPGVRQSTKVEIVQTALSDFYVEYELRCVIEDVNDRMRVLSTLHGEIQDAFNEHGVQIMSPHFVAQPAQNVVVPKAQWSLPPAHLSGSGPAAVD